MQLGDKIYMVKSTPFSGKTEFIDENGYKWARMHPYPREYKVFELGLSTIARVSFEGNPIDENLVNSMGEIMCDFTDRYFFISSDGETKYLIYQEDITEIEKGNRPISNIFLDREEAETYCNELNEFS